MTTSEAPKRPKKTDKLLNQLLAGKFKILKKIGEGGMGSVYIATQEPIDRKVAIKVLLGKLAEDEIAVKRFEQEARAISKMQHPNTVTIYDFGRTQDEDGERLYIVMEYLKGRTLTQVLRADGVLQPARACRIMRQVCASLADAHAAGIIHRDLKPDNIFLTEIGSDKDWVKVLDFGVAKLADSEGAGTLTQTGMIFGTPKYMSPEQAEGRPIDYRADIYAIGVVLYELLVGRPPFVADTPVGLLLKHISEPPAPFARVRPDLQIDPRVEAIVMKSLDKRPERRQQMVAELAAELEAFERAVTGSVPIPGAGTVPAQVPGLPTEVIPGTMPGAQVTPAGLQPPGAVPANLSLGLGPETGHLGAHGAATQGHEGATREAHLASAAYRPADALPTAAQGALHAASVQMTAQGLTNPIAAAGGGVETLGGLSGEISGRHLPRPQGSKSGLLFGGIGLLAAAGALVVFISSQQGEQPVVSRIEPEPRVESPPPKPPESLAAAGLEAPAPEPEPEPRTAEPRAADPRTAEPRGSSNPAPRPKTPEPAPARTVRVAFESEPKGVLVSLRGKQIGVTPFTSEFPRELDVLTFAFSKEGYEPAERTVTPSQDRTVSAQLEKRQQAVAPKPCPDGSAPPCKKTVQVPKPPPEVKPPPGDPTLERVGDLR